MRGSDSRVRGDGQPRIVGIVTALLLATTIVGGGATAVLAAGGATVSADPATAGEPSTHTVMMEVTDDAAGSSLDHIRIDYSAGSLAADVSDVGVSDVTRFGVDRDGDDRIEDSALGGSTTVSASNNGETLTIQNTSGPTNLEEGDVVIAAFGDVTNPDNTGTDDVQVGLNGAQTTPASYEVTAPTTATATATQTATAPETATATETATETAAATGTQAATATKTVTETDTERSGDVPTTETATPTATTTETATATETATETATQTATATATETDAAPAAESTLAVQQRMAEPEPAPLFGPVKAAFVLSAALLSGVIWVVTVRP